MTDFSFEELEQTAGQSTGHFLRDLANTVADGYCSLYNSNPGWIVGSNNDPLTPFRRGLASSLCDRRLPSPPQPQNPNYHGGQCKIPYVIIFAIAGSSSTGFPPFQSNNQQVSVAGPIGAIFLKKVPNDFWYLVIDAYDVYHPENVRNYELIVLESIDYDEAHISHLEINPYGAEDTCGDRLPGYDGIPPATTATHVNLPLPVPGGGNNFTIPLVYVPISGEVDVKFQINATIPINLNFNLGGIHFDFGSGNGGGSSTGFTDGDRQVLTDARQQALNAKISSDLSYNQGKDNASKLDDVKTGQDSLHQKADQINKNTAPRPPLTDPNLTRNQRDPSDRDRTGLTGLQFVEIVLTRLPRDGKMMWGGGAPDVSFGGWFEWRIGDKLLPREQMNFSKNIFLAPKEATGYAYTFTHGAQGYAVEYSLPG